MAVERERGGSGRSQLSYRTAQRDPRYRKPLGARIKDCCRSTIAFIFSNIGVCGLMVGYTIMGAFLFQKIEGPKEEAKYYLVSAHRNETIRRLWNITVAFNTLYPENWTENVEREVREYQNYIVEVVGDGWDGTDGTYGPTMWSIEGGFLYSLTVITTIGYGHIVPKTDEGKIVTIFYTIFGMPVFLLYMANMGDILAKSLKWIYSKLCMCKKKENQYDTSVAWRSADAILRGPAISNFIPPQDNESLEDDYHDRKIATISGTIDRVDQTRLKGYPGSPRNSKKGYPTLRVGNDPRGVVEEGRRGFAPDERRVKGVDERPFAYRGIDGRDPEILYLDEGAEISIESPSVSRSEKTDFTTVNIPITVSLVIMIALLYGGTRLFQSYEGWDGLTSFYFCFISLTTIGFGDYVPGSSVESISSGKRLSFIYCALYLMFGLALLSMCFNLMQEEVVHKITTCIKSISLPRRKNPE